MDDERDEARSMRAKDGLAWRCRNRSVAPVSFVVSQPEHGE